MILLRDELEKGSLESVCKAMTSVALAPIRRPVLPLLQLPPSFLIHPMSPPCQSIDIHAYSSVYSTSAATTRVLSFASSRALLLRKSTVNINGMWCGAL